MTDTTASKLAHAGQVLTSVTSLLEMVDWTELSHKLEELDILGPLIDPTSYHDALFAGNHQRNKQVIRATAAYVAELKKIKAEVPE